MTGPHDALRLQVTVGRGYVDLAVAGDLDLSTADRLHRLLARVEDLDARLLVHLRDVRFLDTAGLEPLMDTARRRGAHAVAGVRICDTSRPVRRLLHLVGSTDTTLNPRAWDEFGAPPSPVQAAVSHPSAGTVERAARPSPGQGRSTWSRTLSALERRVGLLAGERWAS